MSFGFHPEAAAEHLDVVAFYEARQTGLGADYLREFDRLMARVVSAPLAARIVRGADIRSVSMSRFPYAVIYREHGGQITVLAVAHKRRRPGYWETRG